MFASAAHPARAPSCRARRGRQAVYQASQVLVFDERAAEMREPCEQLSRPSSRPDRHPPCATGVLEGQAAEQEPAHTAERSGAPKCRLSRARCSSAWPVAGRCPCPAPAGAASRRRRREIPSTRTTSPAGSSTSPTGALPGPAAPRPSSLHTAGRSLAMCLSIGAGQQGGLQCAAAPGTVHTL